MDPQCDYEPKLWQEIEADINDCIPELIKIVLSKCGFESRLSLCNIGVDDINALEKFATFNMKDQLKQLLKNLPEYNHTKITRDEPFKFLPGHRRIIVEIGKILSSIREATASQQAKTAKLFVPVPEATVTNLKELLCNNILKWAGNTPNHDRVTHFSLRLRLKLYSH